MTTERTHNLKGHLTKQFLHNMLTYYTMYCFAMIVFDVILLREETCRSEVKVQRQEKEVMVRTASHWPSRKTSPVVSALPGFMLPMLLLPCVGGVVNFVLSSSTGARNSSIVSFVCEVLHPWLDHSVLPVEFGGRSTKTLPSD